MCVCVCVCVCVRAGWGREREREHQQIMVTTVVENILSLERDKRGGRRPEKMLFLPTPLHAPAPTLVVLGSGARGEQEILPLFPPPPVLLQGWFAAGLRVQDAKELSRPPATLPPYLLLSVPTPSSLAYSCLHPFLSPPGPPSIPLGLHCPGENGHR